MANQRDELMTVEQILAELCGVSERTFYRWREIGRAPKGLRLPNRELRVRIGCAGHPDPVGRAYGACRCPAPGYRP